MYYDQVKALPHMGGFEENEVEPCESLRTVVLRLLISNFFFFGVRGSTSEKHPSPA